MNFISYMNSRNGLFLLAASGEINSNYPNWSLLSIIGQFIYLTAVFLIIVFIVVYSLRFASRFRNYSGGNNNLRVVETRQLSAQSFVHIVKAGEKYVLVGSSKESVALLAELDKETITDVFETAEPPKFEKIFSQQMKKLFNRGDPPEE